MSSNDFETWMWAEACEILDRAERMQRRFFKPTVTAGKRPTWEPPIDVYETRYELKIMVALPGVSPEHLSIMQENGYLIIDGQRRLPDSAESHIRRLEIPYGRFERRIELPEGKLEMGACEFVNGCLLISLRKT